MVNRRWDICNYTYLTATFAGVTLCSVSLITLTAISVDRLLALLLGLRYRQVVTLKRTCLIAIGGWIVSIVGASTSFLNRLIVSLFVCIGTALCLVTTICAYLAKGFTLTLAFLNSSLNPLLYCWKITEVRQAVKETLQLHFCIN